MIPIAGSAYTYTYATLGELVAWIIGWDLILEYAFSNMSVSVGFAAHVVDLLDWLGLRLRPKWLSPAYLPLGLQDLAGNDIYAAGLALRVQYSGVSDCAAADGCAGAGDSRVGADEQHHGAGEDCGDPGVHLLRDQLYSSGQLLPFSPNGWSGVLAGGSIIFFTYIGFDSVSTASEECKNPQRDVPIGILATLVVCTILYIGVAVVLTGMVPWQSVMGDAAPVVNALKRVSLTPGGHRLHWVRLAVLMGALMGMVSSILVFQLGQARVWFAMSRDRLLPAVQQGASAVPDAGVCYLGGGMCWWRFLRGCLT